MAEYFGAAEDTIYLSGMAAGAATKNGVVGYVVPFAIPEVIRHANAFALGVQRTHPGAKVKLIWTNTGSTRRRRRRPRRASSSAGADVIGPERRQPGGGQFAESKGCLGRLRLGRVEVRAEGVADRSGVRLGRVLPEAGQGGDGRDVEDGLLLRRDQGRLRRARAVRPEGLGRDEGAIAKVQKQIVAGTFNEFQGPLYDQSGKLKVAKGKRLSSRTCTRCTGSSRA